MSLRASLIIPSYRRVTDLSRCVAACLAQSHAFDEIIIVARCDDQETQNLMEKLIQQDGRVRVVNVATQGVISAMQAGLDAARPDSEIIALTDDDSAPKPDWLERILVCFEEGQGVAGVGGRDFICNSAELVESETEDVGVVQWCGRTIGNHHRGVGGARSVEVLKGVNCAFLARVLREIGFDRRLRGAGAQVHWEMSLCFAILRRGWKLIYDPSIAVDHYRASRADADVNHRGGFHGPTLADAAHNETLVLMEYLPTIRQAAYMAWAILVGTWQFPGVLQLMRLVTIGHKGSSRSDAIARWRWTMRGRTDGWDSYRRYRSTPATNISTPEPLVTL